MLTAYTDRIAPLLDPALRLMWTGPGVAPASINASDLTAINKKYGRKVYLWWNYPVNDVLADPLNMARDWTKSWRRLFPALSPTP